jgi:hypothetical protein
MAKRKQILTLSAESTVSLLGISCHLKSYRLSFAMEQSLGFSFTRIDDFSPGAGDTADTFSYPFFVYKDAELKNTFCLVGNHHPHRKLLPSLKQVDYFLMVHDPISKKLLENILSGVRNIPQVIGAYLIEHSKTKGIAQLLEEMELHLLHMED